MNDLDKFNEARKTLEGKLKALYDKYYDRVNGTLTFGLTMSFNASHPGWDATYRVELVFKFSDGTDLFGIKVYFNRTEIAISERTTLKDLETALRYIPVVEKYMEAEEKDEINYLLD